MRAKVFHIFVRPQDLLQKWAHPVEAIGYWLRLNDSLEKVIQRCILWSLYPIFSISLIAVISVSVCLPVGGMCRWGMELQHSPLSVKLNREPFVALLRFSTAKANVRSFKMSQIPRTPWISREVHVNFQKWLINRIIISLMRAKSWHLLFSTKQ